MNNVNTKGMVSVKVQSVVCDVLKIFLNWCREDFFQHIQTLAKQLNKL